MTEAGSRWLSRLPAFGGYGVAVLSVLAAAALTFTWMPLEDAPVSLLLCAVMLSAWRYGLGPGLLATALSLIAFDYDLTASGTSPTAQIEAMPRLLIFVLAALFVCLLAATQKRAMQLLGKARNDLARKLIELQQANQALQVENAERRRAEELARESEQRFRDYAETASDFLWETDPEHRLVQGTSEFTGKERPWGVRWGLRRWDFAADVEEEPEKWRRHIATIEARQSFRDFNYRATREDGSPVYISASGKPVFDAGGRFLGYRGGASDVTAAVHATQAEEALQTVRAALAHATRVTTLGELTASIAHEINQPLAAVVTDASAGRRWLAAEPPNLNEVRQALDRIIREGNRASGIITRIRALLNKSAASTQRLSINETVREVMALTQSELQMHRITLELRLADDLPPVTGDRIQLQQVILNLIVNAVEAMRCLGAGPRELLVGSGRDAANDVLVTVEDSGPGLDPAAIERLFDAFYTTKKDGMGMGLAISRSIIEAHGGRLWATPNATGGAIFRFSVPVEERAEALSSHADAADATR